MPTRSPTDNHGLVGPWERDRSFHLATLRPSSGAERIIDRHWMVRWDLRGREPFQQEILPHPSVNLVVEPNGAWVWGVPTTSPRLLGARRLSLRPKLAPRSPRAASG